MLAKDERDENVPPSPSLREDDNGRLNVSLVLEDLSFLARPSLGVNRIPATVLNFDETAVSRLGPSKRSNAVVDEDGRNREHEA